MDDDAVDAGLSVKVTFTTTGPDGVPIVATKNITYGDYSTIVEDDNKGPRFACPLHLLGVPRVKPCREFFGPGILRHCTGKTHPVLPGVWMRQYALGETE